MRWLAYVHPAAMLGVLVLGLIVLRLGLGVRRERLRGGRPDARLHRRLARVFALCVGLGFASGLGSALGLRGMDGLQSVHAFFVVPAALAVGAAWLLGRQLERGAGMRARIAHATLGTLGLLAALAGAMAGFAILP